MTSHHHNVSLFSSQNRSAMEHTSYWGGFREDLQNFTTWYQNYESEPDSLGKQTLYIKPHRLLGRKTYLTCKAVYACSTHKSPRKNKLQYCRGLWNIFLYSNTPLQVERPFCWTKILGFLHSGFSFKSKNEVPGWIWTWIRWQYLKVVATTSQLQSCNELRGVFYILTMAVKQMSCSQTIIMFSLALSLTLVHSNYKFINMSNSS